MSDEEKKQPERVNVEQVSIDEELKIERWGRDAEADARAESVRQEIENAGRFLGLLR